MAKRVDYQTLVRGVTQIDETLVAAAADVDGDLLDWFSELSLAARLDRAAGVARDLERLRAGRRAR